MSLRVKSSIFIIVTMATILGLVQLLHAQTSLERFEAIEEQEIHADLERVLAQIDAAGTDLSGTNADWAYWDDSRDFILDGNDAFADSNLYAEAFDPIDVDLVVYVTANGQVRYGRWFAEDGEADVPDSLLAALSPSGALHVRQRDASVVGLVTVDNHVLLVSARGVTDSAQVSEPVGVLLMARQVGSAFADELARVSSVDLVVETCGAVQRCIVEHPNVAIAKLNGQISIEEAIHDLDGVPALHIEITGDREIYDEGVAGIKRVFVITAAVGVFAIVVALLLVRRTVGRIESLNNTAQLVSRTQDHTARVRPEGNDEIASLAEGINHMLVGLESASDAKTRFLGRISHEVSNPLNCILGHARLLELDALSETQVDSVDNILAGVHHIKQLLDEFLDTARIAAGQIALRPQVVDLDEIISESIELAAPQARQKYIEMQWAPRHLAHQVAVDPTRLRQILLNLISNAIKYNRENGQIEIDYVEAGDETRITVSDTGPGIPADQLGRLFVPFDRLDADLGDNSGTGLGLVVSKQLAHLMGGDVTVVSSLGAGTSFTIAFPTGMPPAPSGGDEGPVATSPREWQLA